jgi:hypothetical protein
MVDIYSSDFLQGVDIASYINGLDVQGVENGQFLALDPNLPPEEGGGYEIDWESLNFEQLRLEDWQIDLMEDVFEAIENDPNVQPLLEWYIEIESPGELVTEAVAQSMAEGMIESYNDGYYDVLIAELIWEYGSRFNNIDWFFDLYDSVF